MDAAAFTRRSLLRLRSGTKYFANPRRSRAARSSASDDGVRLRSAEFGSPHHGGAATAARRRRVRWWGSGRAERPDRSATV
ncbi:Hypothetical protein NTJ_07772 [Nesidiocoris tenuis]|uniref:Uncharacterized protein n=1 Tax=Nesidiocoris tenuis TaxID=355587 RepID=A0ABN7ASD0_9HEMI|nr:Hypothetical protein NTJ_07772 [Nesidiocoris tenuis]